MLQGRWRLIIAAGFLAVAVTAGTRQLTGDPEHGRVLTMWAEADQETGDTLAYFMDFDCPEKPPAERGPWSVSISAEVFRRLRVADHFRYRWRDSTAITILSN